MTPLEDKQNQLVVVYCYGKFSIYLKNNVQNDTHIPNIWCTRGTTKVDLFSF